MTHQEPSICIWTRIPVRRGAKKFISPHLERCIHIHTYIHTYCLPVCDLLVPPMAGGVAPSRLRRYPGNDTFACSSRNFPLACRCPSAGSLSAREQPTHDRDSVRPPPYELTSLGVGGHGRLAIRIRAGPAFRQRQLLKPSCKVQPDFLGCTPELPPSPSVCGWPSAILKSPSALRIDVSNQRAVLHYEVDKHGWVTVQSAIQPKSLRASRRRSPYRSAGRPIDNRRRTPAPGHVTLHRALLPRMAHASGRNIE